MRQSFKHYINESSEFLDLPSVDLHAEFQKYNKLVFGGKLPPIPIKLKDIKPHGVCISFKSTGVVEVILISSRYKITEEQFKNILVHEMIHAEFATEKVKDTGSHGMLFKNRMREINASGDYKINTTVEDAPVFSGKLKREMVMFIINKIQAKRYVIVTCKPEQADEFMKAIFRRYMRERCIVDEYSSHDPFLSMYPQSRSVKTIKFFMIDDAKRTELITNSEHVGRYDRTHQIGDGPNANV